MIQEFPCKQSIPRNPCKVVFEDVDPPVVLAYQGMKVDIADKGANSVEYVEKTAYLTCENGHTNPYKVKVRKGGKGGMVVR